LPDFVWNRTNPLELQQFLNIVQEGRMIPLKIPEIDEMIDLENKVKSFIHRSGLEVQKGAQLEHIQNLLELVIFIELPHLILQSSQQLIKY